MNLIITHWNIKKKKKSDIKYKIRQLSSDKLKRSEFAKKEILELDNPGIKLLNRLTYSYLL